MFRCMSDRHYTDLPMHLPDPPAPPQLMSLTVHGLAEGFVGTWDGVVESALAAPTIFRFVTLDGKIRLYDMSGRDFVLTPQVS